MPNRAREDEGSVKNKITQLRLDKGLSTSEFARELGLSVQTLEAIEDEHYEPSLSLAFKIAKSFDLKAEDMFFE